MLMSAGPLCMPLPGVVCRSLLSGLAVNLHAATAGSAVIPHTSAAPHIVYLFLDEGLPKAGGAKEALFI